MSIITSKIKFTISEDLREKFELIAEKKGMKCTDFMRYLVMREIDKDEESSKGAK